jgi:transposase
MDKNGKTGRRYSAEEKAAAVRMVRTLRAELGADRGTPQRVWAPWEKLSYAYNNYRPARDVTSFRAGGTGTIRKVSRL